MATNAKKNKPAKVAIGDQILIEVAKWDIVQNLDCSLQEFVIEHEIKIGALCTYGFLNRKANKKYRLTEAGKKYVFKNFPDRFQDKTEAF